MKKSAATIAFILLMVLTVSSQSCLPEGIVFALQEEVENFPANYPDCIEIEGNVECTGDDITNLDSLYTLTAIGGDLIIHNMSELLNLNGLHNISTIGGDLEVDEATSITSMEGLEELITIYGTLDIEYNDNLIDLSGLENLTYVGGNLEIDDNDLLTSLNGLNNLLATGNNFQISGNEILENINGVGSLTTIGEDFKVYWCPGITSLSGLDNLSLIKGNLWINDNPLLTSLDGLEQMDSINGYFVNIYNNNVLESIAGIEEAYINNVSILKINDNPLLATCDVSCVCAYIENGGGSVEIYGNAEGCSSPQEVEENCNASGIYDDGVETQYTIYPVPAKNHLTINPKNISKTEHLKIYHHTGQEVISQPGYSSPINISALPSGIYHIEIITSEFVVRKSFVKE